MTIPIENIYYLLCYSWNKLEEAEQVDVDACDSTELIELFALVLKNGVNILLKKGFDRNYIEFNEDTKRIRGKIDFGQSLKRNLIKQAKLNCHFDELSYNVIHNQIIKTTIGRLLSAELSDSDIRDELRKSYHALSEVAIIDLRKKHFRKVQLNSNNYFYDFLLKVCEIIYDNTFINEDTGKFVFKDFLRNEKRMAALFEDFVRNFYKIELPKLFPTTSTYREDIDWDATSLKETSLKLLPKMQTDISIEFDNQKLIIDTKFYKEALSSYYESEKIISSNLYQIHAYLTNIESKGGINRNCSGMLLYPTVQKEIDETFNMHGHNVRIKTLNLNQDWKKIHSELLNIISDYTIDENIN